MRDDDDPGAIIGDADDVRSVYDQLPLLLLAAEGPRLTFAAANAAYRAVYPKAAIGTSVWDTSPEVADQQIYEQFLRVYETGQPLDAREWRVHMDLDGSGMREVFFDMLIIPWLAADGTRRGIAIVGQDATERVQARRAAEQRTTDLRDRYESVRDSAALMQRALLSPAVPVLPGVDLAAAYLVAAQDTAAGGDWFDVVTGAAGVHLVVGDVVGHGVRAAAVMAQLRTAVRMWLHAGAGIADALAAVERFAAEIPGADAATVCVAHLNPDTGDLEYCTAGHPPPLVIAAADGSARYLPPTGARPLGAGGGFPMLRTTIGVGEVVLLYTDGIIERPGRPMPASTAEVADITGRVLSGALGFPLSPGRAPVQRLCSQAVEMLVRTTGYADDITLLAAQRRTPVAALHAELPADDHAEPAARARLRGWLDALGADPLNGQLLEHALTESVANATQHAYAATTRGSVTVDATLGADGWAEVTVRDHGRWRTPADAGGDRGRGLAMARMLVPELVVTRDEGGTTVTHRHRLLRDAHIVVDPAVVPAAPAPPTTVFDAGVADDGVIVVVGDVDTAAAPQLDGLLAAHGHGGTVALTVDVSAATHLGSAALSVLAECHRRAVRHGTTCTFLAPPGGTAHHVLSLVGLAPGPAD